MINVCHKIAISRIANDHKCIRNSYMFIYLTRDYDFISAHN
jgi:hypothetical protein